MTGYKKVLRWTAWNTRYVVWLQLDPTFTQSFVDFELGDLGMELAQLGGIVPDLRHSHHWYYCLSGADCIRGVDDVQGSVLLGGGLRMPTSFGVHQLVLRKAQVLNI